MKNKLQMFDYMQIFVGAILGLGSKLLEGITSGDIKAIFAIINICAFIYFAQGLINIMEDKYGIKLITSKKFDYSK